MSDTPFRDRTNDRRVGVLLLLGLIVLFGGAYVAGYYVTSDKVPRGASVAGVEIGGLQPAAATTRLEEELVPQAQEPIRVSANDKRGRIRPEAAGLAIDVAASVEQAGGGRSWDPARMWDYFTGGDDLDAVVNVDQAALEEEIEAFASEADEPAKEGGIAFKRARAVPSYPKPGVGVDVEQAAAAILEAYPTGSDVIALPVRKVLPKVSEDKIREAMRDFANPAVSGPVFVEVGNKSIVLRPKNYTKALSLKPQNGTLVPALDSKVLFKSIRPAMRKVTEKPRDATVRIVNGEPTVIPGKNGVTFDRDKVTDQFLSVLVQRGKARTLTLEGQVERPDFRTKDARQLQIKEVVSSFTTQFPHSDYRNTNLGRAAELVNGTVLKPGETFSLNDTVGERTAENGFTEGFIISNGVFKEDFGGGVSQVATTLFNAAFFAGLEDVEHKPHSFYIDRYPIGREATVAWGFVDLKFKNNTPYGVLIQAWINPSSPSSSGQMNVRMWSTKYWDIKTTTSERYNFTKEQTRYIDSEDCVPNDGYGGFDIDVFRYFRKAGSDELVRKEKMHTTYTPSDTVVCGKDPNA